MARQAMVGGVTPEQLAEQLASSARAQAISGAPADLREAFERTLEGLDVPRGELAAWTDGRDVIGGAYERLLTGEQRRDAGQFFTPFWAGELMGEWLLESSPRLLLDAGCGSGSLLIPTARSPRRGDTRLLGLDSDPLAVAMARMNAQLHGFGAAEFHQTDFLLGDLPALPDCESDEEPQRPQAVISNPPYSRHHAIPAAAKRAIHDGLTSRLGIRLNRLAALHTLFLVRALEVAAEEARLAFITPSDWLDVGYGTEVKRFLLDRAQVRALILLDGEQLFFGDGVLTTAAITLIEKGRPNREPTMVLRLSEPLPSPAEVLESVRTGDDRPGIEVKRVRLGDVQKWSRPAYRRPKGVPLSEVARVRRGIATGCNAFFVLSENERIARGLSPDDLRPCATSPRQFAELELTETVLATLDDDTPRWVLNARDPEAEREDTPLGRYLRRGRRVAKAHTGYLAARRRPWYALEERGESPILFSYFNRARPRFVRNRATAVPLNTWLIVEPAEGVDPDELYVALSSDTTMRQLTRGARLYGGGLWKLEPSELSQVVVPATLRPGG